MFPHVPVILSQGGGKYVSGDDHQVSLAAVGIPQEGGYVQGGGKYVQKE